MKKQVIIFIVLMILTKLNVLSSINSINFDHLDSLENEINNSEFDNIFVTDSIENKIFLVDSTSFERKNYTQSEFMYADNYRYTINGEMPLIKTDIDPLKMSIFGGIFTGFIAYQHIYQVNTIWSKSSDFKFLEDGNYALYSDKIGHFYGAYLSGALYTEFFMWSGMSLKTATLTGSLLGVAYSTYVEIMDGYAENWGFSPSDFYSDVAGFGFLLLQNYVPWFQNITPKFMYFPADWHGERKRVPSEFFIDDYSSQSLFFSFNVYNMLPDNLKKYWVPWLQLTVGYAARNLCNPLDGNCSPEYSTKYGEIVAGSPRFIIGLDYDLVKLLPDGIPFWNWLRQNLNYIKFPAPAIEISERGTKFMLMYPFLSF